MNISISIIVPIYNVEKFLPRCLDSILAQTFFDWECILVNDASPDNCQQICDDYVRKDSRFKVLVHKQNQGLVSSRKFGLNVAQGNYIIHIDSDDWIEPNMLENLHEKALTDNSDIVYSGIFMDFPDDHTKKLPNHNISNEDKITAIKSLLATKFMPHISKLTTRNIYSKITLPKYSMAEDLVTILQIIFYAKKIGYIDDYYYHYCFNSDSMTNSTENEQKRIREFYENISFIVDFLRSKYGDANLAQFDPELSAYVNQAKWPYVWHRELRDLNKLHDLYPASLKQIFNKQFKLPIRNKILFFLASNNISLYYYLKDFLTKSIKL